MSHQSSVSVLSFDEFAPCPSHRHHRCYPRLVHGKRHCPVVSLGPDDCRLRRHSPCWDIHGSENKLLHQFDYRWWSHNPRTNHDRNLFHQSRFLIGRCRSAVWRNLSNKCLVSIERRWMPYPHRIHRFCHARIYFDDRSILSVELARISFLDDRWFECRHPHLFLEHRMFSTINRSFLGTHPSVLNRENLSFLFLSPHLPTKRMIKVFYHCWCKAYDRCFGSVSEGWLMTLGMDSILSRVHVEWRASTVDQTPSSTCRDDRREC